jgi:hypothetical protein
MNAVNPNRGLDPSKKNRDEQLTDPSTIKNRMKAFLLPRASAIPDKMGAREAFTKKANERKYAKRAVFLNSAPKNMMISSVYNP